MIGLAFIAISLVPASSPALGAVAFGLAGLGCSALLPLTISLGGADAPAGQLVAAYQLGYGLAAFGIAPLHSQAGLGLRTLFGGASAVALALGVLALMVGGTPQGRREPQRRSHRCAGARLSVFRERSQLVDPNPARLGSWPCQRSMSCPASCSRRSSGR